MVQNSIQNGSNDEKEDGSTNKGKELCRRSMTKLPQSIEW
jgi:hypothetical protein